MTKLLLLVLLVALMGVVHSADVLPKSTEASQKMTILFKSGSTLSLDFDSGTIINLDTDFLQWKSGDKPKQYTYDRVAKKTAKITIDLGQVEAITATQN